MPQAGAHALRHMYVWTGCLLLFSHMLRNRPHRHVPASLLVGLDCPFDLHVDGRHARLRGALVAPHARQSLDSRGGAMLVLHVDPDRPEFRRIAPRLAGAPSCPLPEALVERFVPRLAAFRRALPSCAGAEVLLGELVAALADGPARELDARIAALVERLRSDLPSRLELGALAAELGLSESRLMHLFKAQLGVPLRRFVLGLRLQNAMHLWGEGMNLAELALDAGFYDQPHLIRTARAMVDELPSLLADPRRVRLHRCARHRERAPTADTR
ncbi:MAG: helix-turn-helix transcriptional regulator [Gammaproteobacteria bacterium]|nr:helix-turn-helix transcriptional regulator [Gammaproteobacteria bacterium]